MNIRSNGLGLLRYPGGKANVADKIVNCMPDVRRYAEPFLGGG